MLEKHNFHWRKEFFFGFPKKRLIFNKLAEEIKPKQIVSVSGLRRTGKTTLLKQLIDHLIAVKSIEREKILFYSFDEEQPKLEQIFNEYETKTGKEILELKSRVFVFFDEIQKLENWQNQIKYYYDNYSNIKFFISGSSSLFIKKRAQESLAGRIHEFELNPLSFKEFLIFREKEGLLKKPKLFEGMLLKEFFVYQKRQFIETVNESEEKTAEYAKSIIEKIVFQDIPKVFPIEQEELLLKILKIVASNPGMLVDYGSLSKELGINRVTLSNYFFYLEESFLLKKMYNFSKNMITSEKKMKKIYLTTTSFMPFLNKNIDESKLIENLVVSSIKAVFFWRTPQKHEVDVIVEKEKKLIPIEVKYKNTITKKDLKNTLSFCEKFNVKKAFIITKNNSDKKKFKLKRRQTELEFIPAWKFLLENKI